MPRVLIGLGDPMTLEARNLIQQLDRYLTELYPRESNHLLPIEMLCQPNVTFLIASVDDAIAGCGAFLNQGTYAEIKRLFVSPEYRGLKLGRSILNELEARSRSQDLKLARLETGISQPEAIQLFERSGYRRCLPFGEYLSDPLSIFMEKPLE